MAATSTVDPFGGLEGADRDVAVAIQNLMASYGLGTLAPKILEFVRAGYSGDTVGILLQSTSEYKARFSANDVRRKAGLPVLNPGEYLSVESSYREIMSSAGLPVGFYDNPDDFADWIGKDISPTEIKSRVDVAAEAINSVDPAERAKFGEYYSTGDMIAYALDRDRAVPVLERQWRAAQVGAAAGAQGVGGIGSNLAERIATTGADAAQARQGFGLVAADSPTAARLGAIYGEQYGQQDLVDEVFFDDAEASSKRKRLASKERAAFSGSGGQSRSSLARDDAGQL